MIQRFSFGHPFPTQSVVLSLPAESGPIPFLTPDGSGCSSPSVSRLPSTVWVKCPAASTSAAGTTSPTTPMNPATARTSFPSMVRTISCWCGTQHLLWPVRGFPGQGLLRHRLFPPRSSLFPHRDPRLRSVSPLRRERKCDLQGVPYLIGRSYIPPRWAFGLAQSRWGYKTEEDVREVARQYKEHDLPLDMICMDIEYMQDYADFTVNKERFQTLQSSPQT